MRNLSANNDHRLLRFFIVTAFIILFTPACGTSTAPSDPTLSPLAKTLIARIETPTALNIPLEAASQAMINTDNTVSSPMLNVSDPIQIAWFYKPPQNDTDLELVANNHDFFILTMQDEEMRDYLISQGKTGPILRYLRFEAIDGNVSDCEDEPYHNQIANRPGDFCEISEKHPDWFLLDSFGNRIDRSGFYRIDPANPEWQAWYLNRLLEDQQEYNWKGIFLDNVDGSIGRTLKDGVVMQKYTDDASYQKATEEFLAYLYQNFAIPQKQPLFANITFLPDNKVWFDYLQYLDGAMIENFAVDWSSGYISRENWEEQLDIADETQKLGKSIILVSLGDCANNSRQSFAFATYLLVANGNASFRYADNYAVPCLYDNYNTNLGEPQGYRYQDGTLWKRDFANGSVTVDPDNHTAEIIVK